MDERFSEQTRRNAHPVEFRAALEGALSTRTTEETVSLLQEHEVPVSEVYSVTDALTNDYARARGLVAIEPDGFATLASPIRLTGSVQPRPAPKLGEHNDRINEWLTSSSATADLASISSTRPGV